MGRHTPMDCPWDPKVEDQVLTQAISKQARDTPTWPFHSIQIRPVNMADSCVDVDQNAQI